MINVDIHSPQLDTRYVRGPVSASGEGAFVALRAGKDDAVTLFFGGLDEALSFANDMRDAVIKAMGQSEDAE